MAYTGKQFLDFTGLSTYDTAVKNLMSAEDALSIKFAKIDSTGNYLCLYKSKTANSSSPETGTPGEGGPDFKLEMGSAALHAFVESLGAAVGATLDSVNDTYSVSFTGTDLSSYTNVVAALKGLDAKVGTLGTLSTTEKTSIVGAINEIVTAIANLDVAEFALATVSNNVVTIHGIKEENGQIEIGTDSTKNIVLEEVAYTGMAEDVTNTQISYTTKGQDPHIDTIYPANNLQTTLGSIVEDIEDYKRIEGVVTVEKQSQAESGYAATYVVKQGGTQVGEKINIPLDYLVRDASIKTVTVEDEPYEGAEVDDKYIDFEINIEGGGGAGERHIYIPLDELVSVISGGTIDVYDDLSAGGGYQLSVTVDEDNMIFASLDRIKARKIDYTSTGDPFTHTTLFTNVTNVQGALDKVDVLIQGMDADLDATAKGSEDAYGVSPLAVMTGVTQADGTVTAVDSEDADPFGTATAAYNAITPIAAAAINGLFTS